MDGKPDLDAPNNMFFANQTIQNACATQAILSVLLNADKEQIDIGDSLREFKTFTEGFPSDVCNPMPPRLPMPFCSSHVAPACRSLSRVLAYTHETEARAYMHLSGMGITDPVTAVLTLELVMVKNS